MKNSPLLPLNFYADFDFYFCQGGYVIVIVFVCLFVC